MVKHDFNACSTLIFDEDRNTLIAANGLPSKTEGSHFQIDNRCPGFSTFLVTLILFEKHRKSLLWISFATFTVLRYVKNGLVLPIFQMMC